MSEMTDSRKHHGHIMFVSRLDNRGIADRPTRLDYGADAVTRSDYHSVWEWKEGVRGHGASCEREDCPLRSPLHGVHPAHLSGADPEGTLRVTEHYCVGLHMLYDPPAEQERFHFLRRRQSFCHHIPLLTPGDVQVFLLQEKSPTDLTMLHEISVPLLHAHEPEVLLFREHGKSLVAEIRSKNHLHESRGELEGSRRIHGPVYRHDRTERRHGIGIP